MQSEPSSQADRHCRCGHTGETHTPKGRGYPCIAQDCECRWYTLGPDKPPVPLPDALKNRCKCGHGSFQHQYAELDGPCSKPDCDCQAYAPVTVETVELPEPEGECCGECGAGKAHPWCGPCEKCDPPPDEPDPDHVCERYFCPTAGETESACHGGFDVCCGHPERHISVEPCQHGEELVSECPCTPLCECCPAQAAPQPGGCAGCGSQDSWVDRSICAEPCGSMHDRCSNCGAVLGYCALEHPPQPERRPPLRVAYSVAGGHAYEVCVPGDASVIAEDGALIITHPEAQVLAIVRVAPFKES